MPREVLCDREDTTLFEPLPIGNSTASDELRAIAKATRTDDGVLRIDIHIYHGSEVDVDPHQLTLTSYFRTIGFDELHISLDSQPLATRIAWCILETHIESPLTIESNEHGHSTCLLQALCQVSLVSKEALLEEYPAPLLLLHTLQQSRLLLWTWVDNRHDQLPHTPLQVEALIDAIDPALLCCRIDTSEDEEDFLSWLCLLGSLALLRCREGIKAKSTAQGKTQ